MNSFDAATRHRNSGIVSSYFAFPTDEILYFLTTIRVHYSHIRLSIRLLRDSTETDVTGQKSIIALNPIEVPLINFVNLSKAPDRQ